MTAPLTFPLPVGSAVTTIRGADQGDWDHDERDERRDAAPGEVGRVYAVHHHPDAPEGTRHHHHVEYSPSGVCVILYEVELSDPGLYAVSPAASEGDGPR